MAGGSVLRLRDIPKLAAQLDKVVQQFKGYAERLPGKKKKKKDPYTTAGRGKARPRWE
jgi:hypothetical protein